MDRQGLNELVRLRVRPATLKEYDNALQTFLKWAPDDLETKDAKEIDEELTKYAHYIYHSRDGQGLSLLQKVKSGIEFYFPEHIGKLTQTQLSLQGWVKVVKRVSRAVCPEEVAYKIAR